MKRLLLLLSLLAAAVLVSSCNSPGSPDTEYARGVPAEDQDRMQINDSEWQGSLSKR